MGAVLGALTCFITKTSERAIWFETLGVAIFGAYIGGDFVASVLSNGSSNDKDFAVTSLGLAIVCGLAALALLKLLRKLIGPQHKPKGPRRRD